MYCLYFFDSRLLITHFDIFNTFFHVDIMLYYEFSLLRIFSLVIQPWMSAYIRKTDGVYMYVFGLPHLGPKKQ
jgi:hypothetical protein